MMTSNLTRKQDQMVTQWLVFLVMGFLITLLPGRAKADLVVRARLEPVSVVLHTDFGGCRAPVRAPTTVMAQDRRPEGRIVRIPPRPRSGRYVWVPGRYMEKAQLKKFRKFQKMQKNLKRGPIWIPGHWSPV